MKRIFTFLSVVALAVSSFAATKHLYIQNQTGWEATALYAWADGRPDILGAWPGIQASGTVQYQGAEYLDFQVDESVFPANFIFNNNGGGSQLADYYIETPQDIYLTATTSGLAEAGAKFNTFHLYVSNRTNWAEFDLYAWGDNEAFGTWPGVTAPTAATIDGFTYNDYPFSVAEGKATVEYHLIFHNNVGEGVEGDERQLYDITEARDYFLIVSNTGIQEGKDTGSALINVTENDEPAQKIMRDGMLIIRRGEKLYNAMGIEIK